MKNKQAAEYENKAAREYMRAAIGCMILTFLSVIGIIVLFSHRMYVYAVSGIVVAVSLLLLYFFFSGKQYEAEAKIRFYDDDYDNDDNEDEDA